jgi:crotonobetaine/carnitine-CoA ligase
MPYNTVGKRNLRKLLEQKVAAHPHKTFMFFEEADQLARTYSYLQFDQMVNRTANALLELGVRKGDKVNLHLTNCPEFTFLWFATAKIGAVMMPTNPLSPPAELAYPLNHSDSVISITQPDLLPHVEEARKSCPRLRQVVLARADAGPEGVPLFDSLVGAESDELAGVDIDPLDDAAIMYTSGTTSLPKGVLVTHANYVFLAEVLAKNMRVGPDDRQLVTLPLFHANAQYYSVMSALTAGASVALMPRFSASRFMKQAIRYDCTITSLFGAPMRMILAQPVDPHDRQNSFRLVIFAQNITEAQFAEWDERFGATLMQIYGMTETMGQPLTNPLDYDRDNMTIGMPTLPYECKVVDPSGAEVPEGEAGELLVRGTPGWTIMKGYFKNPEATASTIQDGWLWTGDVVQVGEDGYFRFVDRTKDMIKRSGENVAAGEVEGVIKDHPKVADAAVIGVPDEMRDEAIKAFVILKDGESVTGEEIIEYCAARLSKFRVPEFVEMRDEFPRTSVGKIQKHILRREEEAVGKQG